MMSRLRKTIIRCLFVALLGALLVMLVPAITNPDPGTRRVLFAIELGLVASLVIADLAASWNQAELLRTLRADLARIHLTAQEHVVEHHTTTMLAEARRDVQDLLDDLKQRSA